MLGVVQAAAGDKFWATTGAFAYHRVAVGASGVDRERADLRSKSAVFTNYDARAAPNFCGLNQVKLRWLMNALSWPIAPVRWLSFAESRHSSACCGHCNVAELSARPFFPARLSE